MKYSSNVAQFFSSEKFYYCQYYKHHFNTYEQTLLELLIMQWIDVNLDFSFISLLNIIFILENPMQSKLAFEGILTWVQKVRNAVLDGTFPIKACLPSCIWIALLSVLPKGHPNDRGRDKQCHTDCT